MGFTKLVSQQQGERIAEIANDIIAERGFAPTLNFYLEEMVGEQYEYKTQSGLYFIFGFANGDLGFDLYTNDGMDVVHSGTIEPLENDYVVDEDILIERDAKFIGGIIADFEGGLTEW